MSQTKCITNSDCTPPNICKMIIKNNKPDTRRCVILQSSESIGTITATGDDDNVPSIIENRNEKCNTDSECVSFLCKKKKNLDGTNTIDKYCIDQDLMLSGDCTTKSIDFCTSGRCITDPNDKTRKLCVICKDCNNDSDVLVEPDEMGDGIPAAPKQDTGPPILLSKEYHNELIKDKGILADIIITTMEFIIKGIQSFFMAIYNTSIFIFTIISTPLSYILKVNMWGILDKYRCTDGNNCVINECAEDTITIPAIRIKQLLVILFPPYGVFISLGLKSIKEIIITSILTMLFYIPGLIYGLNVIQ